MSNISNKAYNYKNSITLEELIYSCGLDYEPLIKSLSGGSIDIFPQTPNTYFKKLKIQYEIRDYNLENNKFKKEEYQFNNKSLTLQTECLNIPNDNRSEKVFCLYDKEKLKHEENKLNQEYETEKTLQQFKNINQWKKYKYDKNNKEKKYKITDENKQFLNIFIQENYNNINFILMFKTHKQEYTFIYYYNGEFYKLVIESNISKILDSVIIELNKNINRNRITFDIKHKLFKIISNNILNKKDLKIIFEYNPVLLKNFYKLNNNKKIDVYSYYSSILLNLNKTPINLMDNLYLNKSPIYYEHLQDSLIKSLEFNNNNLFCNKIRIFFNEHKTDLLNNKLIINCVIKNFENCRYDFWEFINIKENKLLIFIVPSIESIETPYLRNFMDLDGNNEHIINMLYSLKKLYFSNNYQCFFHYSLSLNNNTLHLHVIKKDYYKRTFPKIEISSGVFLLKAIYIDRILNNLKNIKSYYTYININQIQ